ncbi:MAG TPA: histidine phosphatase family protein [Marmoricola sp.]|nr:histidine phosphatase family protein [Marmoricola sp.]
MSIPRTLIVMRHAKATPFAATDHERALSSRGVADAAAAGRWAASHAVLPDYVVVSSAARTCGTWKAFAGGAGCEPEVVVDQALYAAETDGALEILRAVPSHARTVMLVGHNPTMSSLVHLLDDGGADPAIFAEVMAGYPTSALAVLDVDGDWADLALGEARIRAFHVGRASS